MHTENGPELDRSTKYHVGDVYTTGIYVVSCARIRARRCKMSKARTPSNHRCQNAAL
ncbi:hypothetical protein BDR03DRAFT_938326, partial [Suillus americanus]